MVNFSGNILTMESFTSQTSDGDGKIELTLQDTPINDNVYIFCGTKGYIAKFDSRAAKVVTVIITKLKYDKTDDPITGVLSNLPTNVTEATAKTTTDGASGGFVGRNTGGSTGTHTHGLSKIYRHDHTPGFTSTSLVVADSQAGLTITIAYAFE